MSRSQSAEERFDARYLVDGSTGCWNWTAGLMGSGYGCLRVNAIMQQAHRYSYARFIGPIPEGALVCHHCDNPRCVNPGHLFVGSQRDNMRDMEAKGRGRKVEGQEHHKARLGPKDARIILAQHKNTTAASLARRFSVSANTIHRVVNGEHWTTRQRGM